MYAAQEMERLLQLLGADISQLDELYEPASATPIETPYTLDPIARFESPGPNPTLSTGSSFNTPSQIDVMTNTPSEKRLAERTLAQSTPGSSAQFQAAEAANKLDQLTTGGFVRKMLAKEGMEYEWGGTSRSTGWDCSGIIYDIMLNNGFSNFPRTSGEIYNHSKKISLKKAINTRGAVLWKEGHIAVSLGNGKTIEAMGEDYGVVVGNAEGRFTGGGILPELRPGDIKRRKPNPKARRRIQAMLQTPPEQRVDVTDMPVDPLVNLPMPVISVMGEMKAMARARTPEEQERVTGLNFAPKRLRPMFQEAAAKYGLDARFIAAVANLESINFDKDVINFRQDSPAGAKGVMQVMPLHEATYGDKFMRNVRENIMVGTAILASYINKAGGDLRLGLAYYNAGPNASQELLEERMRLYSDPILAFFRGEA